jgi:TetR/AcrR family transcriptional repressor of nem operon
VGEIARHPKKTRDAFTAKISELIPLLAGRIRDGSAGERRRTAIATYSMMVGALQIARAVNDRKLSDEILEKAADAALKLAGER